ncbi:PNK3P-domain-containing protein [Pholiota conissans]|uniref:PNK3P-domain-containing protein n=1 Tax=Pholiota conissans TaxID=109636 RepID=A0A9P5YPB9_9AGAR|nr:PNK3P-domain-containing protein [Pholiota conissans]
MAKTTSSNSASPALQQVGPSQKRKASDDDSSYQGAKKAYKIHPFFTKSNEKKADPFQWLKPLGPKGSCLHGVNLQPEASSKIAALDLDGTVIKSSFSSKKSNGTLPTFEWWRSCVPEKLKELHESGYAIILISNQGLQPAALQSWKEKIPLIGRALKDTPFRLMAATQRDSFRKPMPGMWYELERIFKEEDITIDKSASFFVGDAAGRQYAKGKGDFSSTDRKWAENVEITFFTPEEYFLKLPAHANYIMPGFRTTSLPTLPHVTPSSSPIVPTTPTQEVVLFVGYPCLGKSTFYRRHFQPVQYLHINQDTLKTREKCVKALQAGLEAGKSCIIDNTNRNAATRKLYLDICNANNVPTRCFLFEAAIDLAWHNNLYRALNMPLSSHLKEADAPLLPYPAFTGFRDNYEEPQLSEGFTEIKKVNWVFDGTDEERKHWSMWLQINGK